MSRGSEPGREALGTFEKPLARKAGLAVFAYILHCLQKSKRTLEVSLHAGLSSKVEPASARDSPTRAAKIQYDLLRLTIAAN